APVSNTNDTLIPLIPRKLSLSYHRNSLSSNNTNKLIDFNNNQSIISDKSLKNKYNKNNSHFHIVNSLNDSDSMSSVIGNERLNVAPNNLTLEANEYISNN